MSPRITVCPTRVENGWPTPDAARGWVVDIGEEHFKLNGEEPSRLQAVEMAHYVKSLWEKGLGIYDINKAISEHRNHYID